MKYTNVVAIDGPSGSGKSSVAKEVAKRLSLVYIDTGAMYRGLALTAKNLNIPFVEGESLTQFLQGIRLDYIGGKDGKLIVVNDVDLTELIRQNEVSKLASQFSQLPSVRNYLLNFQRELAKSKTLIMEGRDIGSIVFPKAFLKIFLTASDEIRAKRRFKELQEKGQNPPSEQIILKEIKERDSLDSQRSQAPLIQAPDAVRIETDTYNFNEVVDKICDLVTLKTKELS